MPISRTKISLLFVSLLAADISRSTLSRVISEQDISDSNVSIALHFFSYLVTFGLAGALIARVARPRLRLLLAFALDLTAQLLLLVFYHPEPWLFQSHGSTAWFELLAWTNWYMSPVSSALGGIVWIAISSRLDALKTSHDLPCT